MTTTCDDEEVLIEKVPLSDRDAFSKLYLLYLNDLYRYVYLFTKSKEQSEEIVQNVFLKVWERRESLDTVNSFRAYIYKMAKNLLLDDIRKKQLSAKVLYLIKPESEKSYEQSDAGIIYNQYCQIAQNAINLLPKRRRMIVELRTKEDLTLDEIAEKLSISKHVVKKQLYAGLGFIKTYLKQHKECSEILFLFPFPILLIILKVIFRL